jgi:hypothetical protein
MDQRHPVLVTSVVRDFYFSDLKGLSNNCSDASISASVLESALMSNMGSNGSRL